MERKSRPPRMTLRNRLILTQAAATLAAVLVAEVVALGALALLARQPAFTLPGWGLHVTLVALVAAFVGLLLGAWASRRLARRLRRTAEISRAWLRGNLSPRIADRTHDDLGLLAGHLDMLAEHIEQDEQDLDELRESNARLTDQVRALAVVEERNRLARELHDGVKQHLFSLAMTAGGIRTRFDALGESPGEAPDETVAELAATTRLPLGAELEI